MQTIAVIGLGAMGSRMAGRLLQAGKNVRVWNRTPVPSAALGQSGAVVAQSPREAALGADLVLSMVRDDQASEFIWLDEDQGALAGMKKEAVALECSTLSVQHTRQLADTFLSHQLSFVDAPVAGSRPQAEAGKLLFFVGSTEATFGLVEPVLQIMGSAVHHAGPTGSGMIIKLMINGLFGVQLAAVAELLGFAIDNGMNPQRALDIISTTPVCSPATSLAASAMLEGQFAPAFPIELVAKDFNIIHQSGIKSASLIPLCESAGAVYTQALNRGLGECNITGVFQLYGSTTENLNATKPA